MIAHQSGPGGVSVALLVLPAESSGPGTPPARVVPLLMRASVIGAEVSRLYLEVSGPGVEQPVAAELPVEHGAGSVTVAVPAGPQRVFSLRATADGDEDGGDDGAYTGSAAADVRDGTAALLTVALARGGA